MKPRFPDSMARKFGDPAESYRVFGGVMEAPIVNWETREVRGIVTTGSIDEENEVIDPKGIDLKYFAGRKKGEPDDPEKGVRTVYYDHDYNRPVGTCVSLKRVENGYWAKTFITRTQFGQDLLTMMEDRVVRGQSVGVAVREMTQPEDGDPDDWMNADAVIRASLMREYSITPMPANAECMLRAKSLMDKGKITRESAFTLGFVDSPARKFFTVGEIHAEAAKKVRTIIMGADGPIMSLDK